MPCLSQPTGHQKLFLEISDHGDTLDFKGCFINDDLRHYPSLKYKNFQLSDLSKNPTGFQFYPGSHFIHKTLMSEDHQIQIVRDSTDTMRIEILNAFEVYFISIPFIRGHFRIYVNDGKLHQWNYNTLPYKRVLREQFVYDITPRDWSAFQVSSNKTNSDYFVSKQFRDQNLLVLPVNPEDDPNFKNPRRIQHLKREVAD